MMNRAMTHKRLPRRAINGWLNINKPYGMGSTQVVGAVKRILRPEKVKGSILHVIVIFCCG